MNILFCFPCYCVNIVTLETSKKRNKKNDTNKNSALAVLSQVLSALKYKTLETIAENFSGALSSIVKSKEKKNTNKKNGMVKKGKELIQEFFECCSNIER